MNMALKYLLVAFALSLSVRSRRFIVNSASPSEQSQNESTVDVMRRAKIVLTAPQNITFFLVGSTEAVIGWSPPDVYINHDVNLTLVDPPFNETMSWLNHTYPEEHLVDPNSAESANHAVMYDIENTAEDSTTVPSPPQPPVPTSKEELCQSLDYFANYTVNVNLSEEALHDFQPHLISMKDVFNASNVTASIIHKNIVSFSQGCVREYNVYYFRDNISNAEMVRVEPSEYPEVHLRSLQPGTNYTIYVAAVFESNVSMNSSFVRLETKSDDRKTQCLCDWHGTVTLKGSCNVSRSKPCNCRPGYKGDYCEKCDDGFYRSAPYFPCHRCPCTTYASKVATCKFKEGFLTCAKCEVGYTGNICHMCAYGYYRHHKYCVPCNCHNNHNTSHPFMCDVVTGACHCSHNTSGMNCEVCRTGYIGDAITKRDCKPDSAAQGVFKVLSQGVIAGICVGVILTICMIVGCSIYWCMAKNPPKRPFWTVELKDDHEGVNFNTVPNDEFQIVDPKTTMEDMDFYERQGGATQSPTKKKYARLQETA